jgi:hypothetical protein
MFLREANFQSSNERSFDDVLHDYGYDAAN